MPGSVGHIRFDSIPAEQIVIQCSCSACFFVISASVASFSTRSDLFIVCSTKYHTCYLSKIRFLSSTESPSAARIFRCVSIRQAWPFSMRSMVSVDRPACLASSAFDINRASLNFLSLFIRYDFQYFRQTSKMDVNVNYLEIIPGTINTQYS